jgi:adenosylhomocysteine nucleosidase
MSAPSSCTEIGIVVALPSEARGLRAAGAGSTVLRVAVAGIGPQRAALAARRLVDEGAEALLSWGVAGGLSTALAPGDLLLPERIEAEGEGWPVGAHWRAQLQRELPQAAGGRLWCSRTPVLSVAEKQALAARGLSAVDMESAAVAAVAAMAGLPFVAIKAICDPAGRAVPRLVLELLDAEGRLRLLQLPGAIRGGPGLWRELNRLRGDFAVARRALQRAAPPVCCA